MAPYKALYGRKCCLPINWFEAGEEQLINHELLDKTIDAIKKIQQRMKSTQSCQKSYADKKRRQVQFQEGDKVFLKVPPMKGVLRFGKKRKLSSHCWKNSLKALFSFIIYLINLHKYSLLIQVLNVVL